MKLASDPPTPVHPTISVGVGRRLLAAERRRLEELIAGLERHGLVEESAAGTPVDMGPHSQHPADSGTETFDREHEVTLLADVRAELAEVDAADERLSAGRYGFCERCGEPIPEERLEALPATRFCVGDEERYEFGGHYLSDLSGDSTEAVELAGEPEQIDAFLAGDDGDDLLGEPSSPSGPEQEAMRARSDRWLEAEELESELSGTGLLEDAPLGEESRADMDLLEEEILTADPAGENDEDDQSDADDEGPDVEPEDIEGDLSALVRSQFGLDERADDEEPAEEPSAATAAAARGANEFLCATCFQVKALRLLADPVASRCVDCVNNS